MGTHSISLRGIFICSIAALFCSYQFMLQGAPSIMVPQLMYSLDLNIADVASLTSCFITVYLLFQIPGGYLADRCNARLLLVVCCVFMAISCYWFSISESMLSALSSRAFMGFVTAPVIVVCMNLVSRWFPEQYFSTLVGVIESFGMVGGSLGPLILPNLMESYGWQGTMKAAAFFGVVLAVLLALFVRSDPPATLNDTKLKKTSSENSSKDMKKDQGSCDWFSFTLSCLYGFGLFSFIVSFGGLWGVPFFYERFPGEESSVANMVALIFVGGAIGTPLIGYLASVFKSTRKVMLVCSIISPILLCMLIFYSFTMFTMGIICLMAGICCGGYMLAFSVVKKIVRPKHIGVMLAITNGALLLAGPALQLSIGFILEHISQAGLSSLSIQDYQIGFIPLLVGQLMAFLAALFLKTK